MTYPCRDCGVDTIPAEGDREYYEVLDEVWQLARGEGYGNSDNGEAGYFLCIGCLEARLGRRLTRADFAEKPASIPSPWYSDRLNNRLLDRGKERTPQYLPLKLARHLKTPELTLFSDEGGAILYDERYTWVVG